MRALTLLADRRLELLDVADPPPPGAGEVQVRIKAIGLNHLDVWGFRGMAFAKRKLPLIVGVEASGEIAAVGDGVTAFKAGDPIVTYGGLADGTCKACREGRDNLCENVGGITKYVEEIQTDPDGVVTVKTTNAAELQGAKSTSLTLAPMQKDGTTAVKIAQIPTQVGSFKCATVDMPAKYLPGSCR